MPIDRRPTPRSPTGDRLSMPRVGGVDVPPHRGRLNSGHDRESSPPSMPPEDREAILGWLKLVHQTQNEQRERSEERHQESIEWRGDVERRLTQVEGAVLRIQTVDAKLDNLNQKLADVLAGEARQNDQILSLQAQKQAVAAGSAAGTEAGNDAGKAAGKKQGRIAIVVSILAVLADHYLPKLLAVLNQ